MTPKQPQLSADENRNSLFQTTDTEALDEVGSISPISTTSTESEAIMRYILLLERTQAQLQKTEKIMDKLSGQLGNAIAVTESLKSGKSMEVTGCERGSGIMDSTYVAS
ncbi:hypothetical protein HYFRA_00010525 [Hymenoscyphus fraxineus]|uniref:Uncharacterized protein n=1 Tax=Hymenoscyphus fraxineus TaxID=746836 RepID=A0A9N9L3V4_9HELO|nr:hypothetical protein HYFRA_00010525 [Hymenoscyphus fraxineus]